MKLWELWKQEAQYDALLHSIRQEADGAMLAMCCFLQLVCLLIAPIRVTWWPALILGGSTLALARIVTKHLPGELLTRLYMGCAFMAYTGLIIHQTASLEGHFSAFGLIGCLLFYRDWRTIIVATIFIYMHHMILGYAQVLGAPIFVFPNSAYWQNFGVHVIYFLPFIVMMTYLAVALRRQGADGQRVRILSQQILEGDITHHVDAQDLPAHSELLRLVVAMRNRLMELVHLMPVPIAVIRLDTQTVVDVNLRWQKMFERPADFWTEQHASRLICWSAPEQWDGIRRHFTETDNDYLDNREYLLKNAIGESMLASISAMLHREGQPQMLILSVEDITQRREAENTLRRLAYEDLLSGLSNRASLHDSLQAKLNLVQHTPFALLLLDLDGFKAVNDTLGHDAGDEVLRVVGQRLLALKRKNDIMARLGGDEFCVVIDEGNTVAIVGAIAQRIIDSIMQPVSLPSGATCSIGVSIGLTLAQSTENIAVLFKQADIALYEAKRAGKACWRVSKN